MAATPTASTQAVAGAAGIAGDKAAKQLFHAIARQPWTIIVHGGDGEIVLTSQCEGDVGTRPGCAEVAFSIRLENSCTSNSRSPLMVASCRND